MSARSTRPGPTLGHMTAEPAEHLVEPIRAAPADPDDRASAGEPLGQGGPDALTIRR